MPNRPAPHDDLTSYEKFHRLCARPFSLTPDLRFTYQSRSHARAFDQAAEALRHRDGVIVITGDIGTGKTMLSRALLETLEQPRTFLSVILDPLLTAEDLIYQVLADFGVTPKKDRPHHRELDETSRHQLVTTLQQFVRGLTALDAQAVILVDEAQHLDPKVLEQLRLLSNFETDAAKVLQIVLIGQRDLDAILERPDMQALNQRVARRIELQPLDGSEVQEYVERRLAVAACPDAVPGKGGSSLEFSPSAYREIERLSNGIPRVINTLCDRALEVGAERQTSAIDGDIVRDAAQRLKLGAPKRESTRVPADPATPARFALRGRSTQAAAVVVLAAGAGAWWWSSKTPAPGAPAATPAPARPAPSAAPQSPVAAPTSAPPSTGTPQPTSPAGTSPAGTSSAGTPSAATSSAARQMAPSPSAAADRQGNYRIVVAAFKTSKRAMDVAGEIVAKGLPATSRADAGGTWQLVIVGPYGSAEEAQAAQKTLADNGYPDTRIVADQSDK